MTSVQLRRSVAPAGITQTRGRSTSRLVLRVAAWASGVVVALAGGPTRTPPAHTSSAAAPVTPTSSEAEIRELDIAFYQARADRDPTGAADLAHLSALYLQRSRDTGDPRDAERAEQAARRSLHNRSAHNSQAAQVLAASLLSQHRFAEALVVARGISDRDPDAPALRAAVGEIEMELGRYDEARATFAGLRAAAGDIAVAPRLARWAELHGQVDAARTLLHGALATAMDAPSLPREQVAWFWLRSGDLELRTGHLASADSAYQRGLRVHPEDYRLLAALSRLAAVRQDWSTAVRYGEQAIAANLDPATLGTLSDAYAALGDSARSEESARTLEVAVLTQPGAYHRAWSLFLLNHDRHVETVYRKVREELQTRRDIYGYDLLAWSLHKKGRDSEARAAMTLARAQGTQDAQLLYHAGMIELGLGREPLGRDYLRRALAVNPYFDPAQASVARATLAGLAHTTPGLTASGGESQ